MTLVHNAEYAVRNNHSSIYAVRDKLRGEYAALFQLLWIGLLLVFPGLALPALKLFAGKGERPGK